MATKLKVILQRSEAKDYRDIAALLQANVSLSRGLASARLMFRPTFQPSEQRTLVRAASEVRELPAASIVDWRLS